MCVVWHFHVYLILRRFLNTFTTTLREWHLWFPNDYDTCVHRQMTTLFSLSFIYWLEDFRERKDSKSHADTNLLSSQCGICCLHFDDKQDIETLRNKKESHWCALRHEKRIIRSENMLRQDVHVTRRFITTYSSLLWIILLRSRLYISASYYCYFDDFGSNLSKKLPYLLR